MDERIINYGVNGKDNFPRELTSTEKDLLFSILPLNKTGYKIYRDKIDRLKVIGKGRFGGGNLVLGPEGSRPDESLASSPVFASGTVEFEECIADVNIHEENEDQIEIDISISTDEIPSALHEKKRWSYSDWMPGQKAPNDGSYVREINIGDTRYLMVIAPAHKKIWLHETSSGVNHLVPVSNLYNYLMMMKNIREADIVSKPVLFFQNHNNYNDAEIMSAFLVYNKYFKKFKIDYSGFEFQSAKPKKKSIFKIFKKG